MPARAISSRLAAHASIRQVAVELRCEAAADAVDRAVASVWRDFLDDVRNTSNPRYASAAFWELLPVLRNAMGSHLRSMAIWGHRSAAENIIKSLPAEWLAMGVISYARRDAGALGGDDGRGQAALGTNESRLACAGSRLAVGPFQRSGSSGGEPRGAEAAGQALLESEGRGLIAFARDWLRRLFTLDLAAPLRKLFAEEPPAQEPLSDAEAKDLFASILFPPPSEEKINGWLDTLLSGQTWYQALDGAARAAQFGPEKAAQQVAASYAAGKGPREIAKDVLPFVDGVRYRARRLARTYGLAVAHESQMEAHSQLGPLVIGYQLHATLDSHSRPWHAHRNGAAYYAEPKRGQKGQEQMPRPPQEPEDPGERPVGTPQTAYN